MEQEESKTNRPKKKNIFARILTHAVTRNLILMGLLVGVLITATLLGLNKYTKHNESITVPNIKGLKVTEADKLLASAGLKSEIADSIYHSTGAPGAVLEQVPMAASHVKKGRTVFLTIQAIAPQMVHVPPLNNLSKRQALAQLNSLGFDKVNINEVPSQYAGLVLQLTYNGDSIAVGQKIPKGSTLSLTIGKGGKTFDENSYNYTDSQENIDVEESFFD